MRRGFRAVLTGVLTVALAGCGPSPAQPVANDGPGARLEAAAVAQGLVIDPAAATLAGAWGRDTDRVCVVGAEGGAQAIGARVDHGEGQGCAASGTVRRRGGELAVDLGRDCRFDATFDGERIVFPAELPEGCAAACRGRASLSALDVERWSDSVAEASTLRGPDGRALCGG